MYCDSCTATHVLRSLCRCLCSLLQARIEVNLPTALDDIESVIERASPDIRVKNPVLRTQLLDQAIPLLLGSRGSVGLLFEAGADPLNGDILDLLGELLALGHQGISRFLVGHLGILVLRHLDVFIFPVFVAFELFQDLAWVDVLFEILTVLREVNLRCDDWVEPALDNAPDAWFG